MANERVPAVVDCQHTDAVAAKRLATCEESAAKSVALERLAPTMGLYRANERVGVAASLGDTFRPPRDQVRQRARVPLSIGRLKPASHRHFPPSTWLAASSGKWLVQCADQWLVFTAD